MGRTTEKDDFKYNMHRFRIRRRSPITTETPASAQRRRSASPLVGPAPRDTPIPACDRCRNFKKKCSRTLPVCTLCASAGQDCSFSAPSSSAKAQAHHLRARVEWLSRLINDNLLVAGGPGIEGMVTGADLSGLLAPSRSPVPVSSPSVAELDLTAQGQAHCTGTTPVSANLKQHFDSDSRITAAFSSLGPATKKLAGASNDHLARTMVDAYFRHIHRAYPFMDRVQMLRDLKSLGSAAWPPRRADSTLLFLTMALGWTTLQRSGQMPVEAASFKFDVPSGDIIQECLLKNDLESIQILVLLALHCLYDPAATSTWTVASLASHKALSYGLSRRASDNPCLSSKDKELHHRLFWSTWVLDRLMAVSTGLPPALSTEGIDVPLPSLAVEEFISGERHRFASVLQTHRHVIHLRQIEDRILSQILSRNQPEFSQPGSRLAMMKDMRTEIENWYSEGCLLSPLEPDNVPIHTSVAWLSARYYHLLLMLHYPCPSNGFGSIIFTSDLLHFAQKHLKSTLVLLQHRQLPLNYVTLARTLPVGLVLIHCLMSGEFVSASADELETLINVFEAFPNHWTQARRAGHVFRQLKMSVLEFSSSLELLKPLAAAATAVMVDVLGKTTCYIIQDFLCKRGSGDKGLHGSNSRSPTNSVSTSMASLHKNTGAEQSWSSLQFAFL